MQNKTGTFTGVRNAKIFYQSWLPDGDPRAILLIVHGLAEHSGRYKNVVNHFVPLGYAAFALDHFGHGQSEGTRIFVESFEDYTHNLKKFFDQVKEWNPGKKIFLVGHSLGGLIVSYYLLDHQKELDGAVISAPAVKISDSISSSTIMMGKILSKIAPKAGLMVLDANGVSRDPEVVQAYINDPLVYRGKITARLAAEMIRAMQRVTAEANQIRLPILLVQGGDDKLVDPGGAQMLFDKATSLDKTLKNYPGLYHEVFNEPERAQVLGDVEQWLAAHVV